MPDIFQLIAAWRKQILLVVLVSMVAATAIVFILPQKYLASSTAIASNPFTADKATVFNSNIRELYNSLGDPSDLDKIIGTGQSDTIYLAVAAKYDLVSFYGIKGSSGIALFKAAKLLKKDSKISKTEFGELQVSVWCKDKLLAPQLANALMDELAAIHQGLLNSNNEAILQSIMDTSDSLRHLSQNNIKPAEQPSALQTGEVREYEKLAAEYSLMLKRKPPALLTVDRARINDKPDTPKRPLILIATALLSFLFALWLALLLEKRKQQTS